MAVSASALPLLFTFLPIFQNLVQLSSSKVSERSTCRTFWDCWCKILSPNQHHQNTKLDY